MFDRYYYVESGITYLLLFLFCRSNIVWEQYKKNRWKTMTFRLCEALEEGYEKVQQGRRSVAGKEKVLDMEVI